MVPPALAAVSVGADVTGCDRKRFVRDDALARAGIPVEEGHDVRHLDGRHLVVTTLAPPDLPEVRAAADAGRLHHRTDLLEALVRGRTTVAVTGTHGKGTVAALVGCALEARGADPLVLLGVSAGAFDGPFRAGDGPVVLEADDADGSIARIPATISVVTNSWFDHPMLERSRGEVIADVARHVAAVPADGRVVLGRGANLREVEHGARAPVWRLGRDFDVETISVDDHGRLLRFRDPDGTVVDGRVRIHGGEVADNAAVAFAALRALGLSADDAVGSLDALDVLARRVEPVGEAAGVRVFDDYGKHPESMAAGLRALRELAPRRLHLVYEPNLHADVLRWRRRWAEVLGLADTAIVLPVDYRASLPVAREAPPDWAVRAGADTDLATDRAEALELVAMRAKPGDIVVVSGVNEDLAGFARAVVARLEA